MSPPLLTGLLHQRPSASTTEAKGRLAQLTKREFDVLNLLIEGFHQSEISRRLFVSENTVRTHSQNLQRKLGVHSAVAAVSVALDAGLRPAA
jgi:DNA-binding NarL/FixJ family response regulator